MPVIHRQVVAVADDGTSPVGTNEWNDTHKLTLDGLGVGLRVGSAAARYYIAGQWGGSALTTGVAHTTNTIRAYPFVPPRDCTVAEILAEVTTIGTSSRVGIWNDDGNCHPGTLVAESSSGAVAIATTGVKTYTFSTPPSLLGGTLYWFGIAVTGTPVFRAVALTDANPILGMPSTLGATSPGNGWQTTFTLAALGTWVASSETILTGAVTALAARMA